MKIIYPSFTVEIRTILHVMPIRRMSEKTGINVKVQLTVVIPVLLASALCVPPPPPICCSHDKSILFQMDSMHVRLFMHIFLS